MKSGCVVIRSGRNARSTDQYQFDTSKGHEQLYLHSSLPELFAEGQGDKQVSPAVSRALVLAAAISGSSKLFTPHAQTHQQSPNPMLVIPGGV
jgi:hypothetical protein